MNDPGPQAALLADGRLHLQHGPIDMVIAAWGPDRERAFGQAVRRFQTILTELVDELDGLRQVLPRVPGGAPLFQGPTARRMARAVRPHKGFITPMAAVAGAVADEVLFAMTEGTDLRRAYVNNGGDIAVHLAPGASLCAALFESACHALLSHERPVRGIATSGRGGRSHSLGIADAVSVVAATAAEADAAATLIANAVDLPGHPGIRRCPARDLSPDSDLGQRLVVTGLSGLTHTDIQTALAAGMRVAEDMCRRGLVSGALLHLLGDSAVVGQLQTASHEDRDARLQVA